jgi:antitoxin HicB
MDRNRISCPLGAASKNRMARLMKTSRAQLDRLLDEKAGNVTIETLQRAATVLGRSIRLELI